MYYIKLTGFGGYNYYFNLAHIAYLAKKTTNFNDCCLVYIMGRKEPIAVIESMEEVVKIIKLREQGLPQK